MQTGEIKTKAVVTRAVPYKESDMIVTLVSVEYGKLTATARGCLKPNAKLRYAAAPMNFGDYVLSGRNGRYVITDCSQIEAFLPVTYDLEKYYAGILTLEVLQKLSEEPQPQLFVHAIETLNDLAYSDKDTDTVVTHFLLKTLECNGNALDFAHCNVCKCDIEEEAYFKDADGIVCKHCKGLTAIPVDAISRAYLCGERTQLPHEMKVKANILLADFVYNMLGVRIGTHYFTEQI